MTRTIVRFAVRTVFCALVTCAVVLVMSLPDIIVNLIFGQYA